MNYQQYQMPAQKTFRERTLSIIASPLFFTLALFSAFCSAVLLASAMLGIYSYAANGYIMSNSANGLPILQIIYFVLFTIGTVGLFSAWNGAKTQQSEKLISGLGLSKCLLAAKDIAIIALYIVSGVLFVIGILVMCIPGFFNSFSDQIEGYDEFLNEFGGFTGMALGLVGIIFIVISLFLLAAVILYTVYRKKITRTRKQVILAITENRAAAKVSLFHIVMAFIFGIPAALSSFSEISLSIYNSDMSALFTGLLSLFMGVTMILYASLAIKFRSAVSDYLILRPQYFNQPQQPQQPQQPYSAPANPVYPVSPSSPASPASPAIPLYTAASSAAAQEPTVNCPSCNAANNQSSLFCEKCGSTLTPKAPSETPKEEKATAPEQSSPADKNAPEGSIVCPSCGYANQSGFKFCESCGTKLPEASAKSGNVCSACGHVSPEGSNFCEKCGNKF